VIRILTARHAAGLLRRLRVGHDLTCAEVGRRTYTSGKTVANREGYLRGLSTEALIDLAGVYGFDVALVPRIRWRPTGTGWPEATP
jgi:hypothetical protein